MLQGQGAVAGKWHQTGQETIILPGFEKKGCLDVSFLFFLLVLLRFPQQLQSGRPHVGLVFPDRTHMGLAWHRGV